VCQRSGSPLPKEIGYAVARDSEQPPGNVIDRHQETVCLYEPIEHVLQNVLGVLRIGHPSANEVPQPGLLPGDDFRELRILHLLWM
jgi:hypothetical protein